MEVISFLKHLGSPISLVSPPPVATVPRRPKSCSRERKKEKVRRHKTRRRDAAKHFMRIDKSVSIGEPSQQTAVDGETEPMKTVFSASKNFHAEKRLTFNFTRDETLWTETLCHRRRLFTPRPLPVVDFRSILAPKTFRL